jgi:hypothetical protein
MARCGGGRGAVEVGVLVEVPVMLSLVRIVNRSTCWQEASPAVIKNTAGDPGLTVN